MTLILTLTHVVAFLGGCLCTMVFAQKLAAALAEELHHLGNRLERK
jgi:hypothetical protein